jgi:hypothetical protein
MHDFLKRSNVVDLFVVAAFRWMNDSRECVPDTERGCGMTVAECRT